MASPPGVVTITVALVMKLPEGSVTWPRRVPPAVCACRAGDARGSTRRTAKRIGATRANFWTSPNVIKAPECLRDLRRPANHGVPASPPGELRLQGERMD